MNEWMPVNTADLNREVAKEIRGVRVKVSLSPYDVPQRVRSFKEGDSTFVVELSYLTPETLATLDQGDGIVFEVGKDSRRIHRIKLDVVKLGLDSNVNVDFVVQAEKNVVGAIQEFVAHEPVSRLGDRYRIAQSAITSNRHEIFSPLATH